MYRIVGRYDDSKAYYIESLTIRENALGPGHPQVATSLNNLAGLYRAQVRLEEAELLYSRALGIRVKALTIWEKKLGPQNPNVATVLENMAELYKTTGKAQQANELQLRAQKIRSRVNQ